MQFNMTRGEFYTTREFILAFEKLTKTGSCASLMDGVDKLWTQYGPRLNQIYHLMPAEEAALKRLVDADASCTIESGSQAAVQIAGPMLIPIVQDWVAALGLRHQGVLMAAIRGCDTAPKEDASKLLSRCYRAEVLVAHCGDAAQSKSFIEKVNCHELELRMELFRKNLDHYPHHFVMHFVHAVQIIGYKQPPTSGTGMGERWMRFYYKLCKGLHVKPESQGELDERLCADEVTFGAEQKS